MYSHVVTNGFQSDILGTEWNGTIVSGQENATFSIDILVDTLAEFDEHFSTTLIVLRSPKLAVSNQDGNVALVVIEDDGMVTMFCCIMCTCMHVSVIPFLWNIPSN